MSNNGVPNPIHYWLLSIQIFLFSSSALNARTAHGWGTKHQNPIKGGSHNLGHGSSSSSVYDSYQPYSPIFDVPSFGARGDGVSDDSKAFQVTWSAACAVKNATIKIPSKFRLLISPITLQGPCEPGLVLQIDGMIVAPGGPRMWLKPELLQWINFKNLHDFVIQGRGTINGQGSAWWWITPRILQNQLTNRNSRYDDIMKPTAVRFYSSLNLTIRDIQIQNSPRCHLKFDNCAGVKVTNLSISSPGDSPNTDGIHLQNSQRVEVENSTISCGDDCISIQTGCSDVNIRNIKCGPGHGISIGGLGKDGTLACVSNIVVQNSIMVDTLYGIRIKTWQGGVGSVKSVIFSDIKVSNVKVPIMIDQFYCEGGTCRNKTDAVSLTNITYNQINGTYATQAIHLACSDSIPCTNISMGNVLLTPSTTTKGLMQDLCWNSYGKSLATVFPPSLNCLETGNPLSKKASNFNRTHFTC
ncbi:polygalacturonase At1g48100-like isoform X1 [Vitis riparia]|uniref:polygalacturonase At1g48100-like isoform X1 n=1 Tax=Vitis riparia TaxID=96939 RepID=UPI00155AF7A0|nr:polygalacturonase At1g48100-like isoform X1 [Vitis riparia]